jgi:hypothetical protein
VGVRTLAQEGSLTLTDDELFNLTRKKRPAAQARALRSMGIEHRTRPDGSVAVLRAALNQVFGMRSEPVRRRATINWED